MKGISLSLSFSIFIIFGEISILKTTNRGAVKVQTYKTTSRIVLKLDMKMSIILCPFLQNYTDEHISYEELGIYIFCIFNIYKLIKKRSMIVWLLLLQSIYATNKT